MHETGEDKAAILERLRTQSIDMPMGGAVEYYCDLFGADDELRDVVRRFLDSGSELNRSATIQTLLTSPEAALGLETDALLLHFVGQETHRNVDIEAARYLHEMAAHGSETAKRILKIL